MQTTGNNWRDALMAVCAALGCLETQDVEVVTTAEYGRRALCPEHRTELEVPA